MATVRIATTDFDVYDDDELDVRESRKQKKFRDNENYGEKKRRPSRSTPVRKQWHLFEDHDTSNRDY